MTQYQEVDKSKLSMSHNLGSSEYIAINHVKSYFGSPWAERFSQVFQAANWYQFLPITPQQ